jgi:hypothetical protein
LSLHKFNWSSGLQIAMEGFLKQNFMVEDLSLAPPGMPLEVQLTLNPTSPKVGNSTGEGSGVVSNDVRTLLESLHAAPVSQLHQGSVPRMPSESGENATFDVQRFGHLPIQQEGGLPMHGFVREEQLQDAFPSVAVARFGVRKTQEDWRAKGLAPLLSPSEHMSPNMSRCPTCKTWLEPTWLVPNSPDSWHDPAMVQAAQSNISWEVKGTNIPFSPTPPKGSSLHEVRSDFDSTSQFPKGVLGTSLQKPLEIVGVDGHGDKCDGRQLSRPLSLAQVPRHQWPGSSAASFESAQLCLPGILLKATTSCTHVHWAVDARKLRRDDKQAVSPAFSVMLPGFGMAPFKILLYANSVPKAGRKSGGFVKANACGRVLLKCESQLPPSCADIAFRIGIGRDDVVQPFRGPAVRNFSEHSCQGLPACEEEWCFAKGVDQNDIFVVTAEIAPKSAFLVNPSLWWAPVTDVN